MKREQLRNYYCVVNQEQAREIKYLLIDKCERIWLDFTGFLVLEGFNFLHFVYTEWYVYNEHININKTETTYQEFKRMLNEIED